MKQLVICPNLMSHIIKYIVKIMPLCLALFFCRTVFIGYKYLFFVVFVPCVCYSVYVLFKEGIVRPRFNLLLLPSLVILSFFIHFSPFTNVVKESVNIALIVYFVVFSKLYYADDKCDVFLKWIVRLTVFAGCIAILRFALSDVGISFPLYNVFFEGANFSLVNDWNFYSLFFIISIILSTNLFTNGHVKELEFLIVNIVSAINIVAGLSRRAYVLYTLVISVMFVCVVVKGYDFKKGLLYNTLTICVFVVVGGGILYLSSEYYSPEMPFDQKYRYYKMYSLLDNGVSYREFDIKQQRKYYSKIIETDSTNLFYNGDLKNGLFAWEARQKPHDCIHFGMYEDECGDSVIRVARGC